MSIVQSANPYQAIPTVAPNPQQVVIPQITIPQPLQYYSQVQNQTPLPAYNVPGPQLLKTSNGIDGAKQLPTVANGTYAIFEEDDDVFYVKVTDKNNYPVSLRRFRFFEEEEPVQEAAEETVTKEEYQKLFDEVKSLREEMNSMKEGNTNAKQPVRTKAVKPTDVSSTAE